MKGDKSKFSITLIHQNYETLSRRIPIEFLSLRHSTDGSVDQINNRNQNQNTSNDTRNNDTSLLQQALQLCHARFGKEYETKLKLYITKGLHSFFEEELLGARQFHYLIGAAHYIEVDDSSFAPRSLWAGVKEDK